MTVFKKNFAIESLSGFKGKNLTSSFIFITKEIINIWLLSCLIYLKIPFVYYGNRKFK